jgi:hypothetical protein
LSSQAACPTMDAVVLSSDKDTKLSLWRVAGQAGKVWQTDLGLPLEQLAWSPDGKVAAGLTNSLRLACRSIFGLRLARSNLRRQRPPYPFCAHWPCHFVTYASSARSYGKVEQTKEAFSSELAGAAGPHFCRETHPGRRADQALAWLGTSRETGQRVSSAFMNGQQSSA